MAAGRARRKVCSAKFSIFNPVLSRCLLPWWLSAAVFAFPLAALAEDPLARAVDRGTRLAEAIENGDSLSLRKFANYGDIRTWLDSNRCPGFRYTGYFVRAAGASDLYLIASRGKDIIIGRHFKAPVSKGRVEIEQIESSTARCLNLGRSGSNTGNSLIAHPQPFPNEFHVLQSRLHRTDLRIATTHGNYMVSKGRIRKAETAR